MKIKFCQMKKKYYHYSASTTLVVWLQVGCLMWGNDGQVDRQIVHGLLAQWERPVMKWKRKH